MRRIPLTVPEACALVLGVLGAMVTGGWLSGWREATQVVPGIGWSPVAFNSGLMFLIAAVGLFALTRASATWRVAGRSSGISLIVLAGAILFQHASGIDLGIDWSALHSGSTITTPGRSAPNTCLAFMLTGVAFLLWQAAPASRGAEWTMTICCYGTLSLGLLGIVGYLLNLPAMYKLASFNSMLPGTAMGITILGGALTLLLERQRRLHALSETEPDQRIINTAIGVLIVVALVAGLAGFGILKQNMDEAMATTLASHARSSAHAFEGALAHHVDIAAAMTHSGRMQRMIKPLTQNRDDRAALAAGREIASDLERLGFTSFKVIGPGNNPLYQSGQSVEADAVVSVALGDKHPHAALFWDKGFVLRTRHTISDGDHNAEVITEQRLADLTDMLSSLQQLGESNDLLLCGRAGNEAVCFPTRFYTANMRVPIIKDGKPYLPISRTMLGQSGVLAVRDLRNIPVLAGYAPVNGFALGLVAKVDAAELHNPIRKHLNWLLVVVAALVGVGTLALKTQVAPLASRLQRERRRLRTVLDTSYDAFVTIDAQGMITEWNPQAEKIFGWKRDEVMGRSMAEIIIPPQHRDAHHAGFARYATTGAGPVLNRRLELSAQRRDGEQFPVEITITPVQEENTVSFAAFLHDISERKQADQALRDSQSRLVTLTDNMPALIAYIGRDYRYRFNNRTYHDWIGAAPEDLRGKSVRETFGEQDYAVIAPHLDRAMTGQKVSFERILIDKHGAERHAHTTYVPHYNEDGTLEGLHVLVLDVTERKKVEIQLHAQATRDSLTGLPNRAELMSRLQHAIDQTSLTGKPFALMFLDLDGFKQINDNHGHEAGDMLLQQFAQRLLGCVRRSDTVARLAGDEFCIVVENLGHDVNHGHHVATTIADKILKAVEQPVLLSPGGDLHTRITTSIGIAVCETTEDNESLLARADFAMYTAKRGGKNRYALAPALTAGATTEA